MTRTPTPPHVARRLKKTLLPIIIGGIVTVLLLSITVVSITNNILRTRSQAEETAVSGVNQVLTEQKQFELPENTSNVPTRLDKTTLVTVVAKNQPAVVRILSVYCADITVGTDVSAFTIKDACTGGVGSGSIISSDGYVATNGHVVDIEPKDALLYSLDDDSADQYLTYLVTTNLLPKEKAAAILAAVKKGTTGSSEALSAAVALIPSTSLSVVQPETSYAIQLGNEPVRRTETNGRIAVDFNDTIVSAKLVAKDFDKAAAEKSLVSGEFTTSDVAVLKMEGIYPSVRLASTSEVEVGDQLTAIGFPAFVDGAVDTSKWQTVPSVTQGNVTDVTTDASINGRVIMNTTVQIAQGNSGGPAFNDQGEQIGLNTYAAIGACEDKQCFSDGVVRDIADLSALLKKNKITLRTGTISDDWSKGLDAYVAGNYAEALVLFRKVQDEYPANYLVAPLARVAREQSGSTSDTSSSFQALSVTATVLIVVGITAVVVVVIMIGFIIYFTSKHHRDEAKAKLLVSPNTPL